jgi:ferric-dicitrate binding protein FerR (iron transport regulator)
VALEDGEVVLTFGEKVVRMKPGEIRQAGADSLALSVSDATAWLRGDLVFKDQEVGDILDEVRRRYAVHLILQPDSLRTTRLHLALRNHPDAEAVVRDLAGALGLNYRRRSNGFELYH